MPRAATSVATRVSTRPASKPASARSRWPCDLSPCIATALHALRAEPLHEPVRAALGAHEDERQVALRAQLARRARRRGWRRSTATKRCSIDGLAARGRARARAAPASRVYSRATRPASPSSVAEKNIVWRLAGHRATIRSTAGRKPMSSMRSASSSTRKRTFGERDRAPLEQVLEPAGGRHEDVRLRRPREPAWRCRPRRRRRRSCSARAWATERDSSTIWLASSRVGASTSAAGRRSVGGDAVGQRDREGERLAGPGRATSPSTSRPARTSPITRRLDRERVGDAAAPRGRGQRHRTRRDRRMTALTCTDSLRHAWAANDSGGYG